MIWNLERKYLVDAARITFTKHAIEKFDVLRDYGFEIQRKQIIETILDPEGARSSLFVIRGNSLETLQSVFRREVI
jgi:hypothetical protein